MEERVLVDAHVLAVDDGPALFEGLQGRREVDDEDALLPEQPH